MVELVGPDTPPENLDTARVLCRLAEDTAWRVRGWGNRGAVPAARDADIR